jgi:hypothetical protein
MPLSCSKRQAQFVEWVMEMFIRAGRQGILLEPLTDSDMEWIRRM